MQDLAAHFGMYAITGTSVVLVGTLVYSVLRMLYNLFFHPLRAYPGPLLWRATSIPYDIHAFRGDLQFKIRDMHKTYGDVVRVSPIEISFASDQAIKDSWAHKPGKEEFPKHKLRRQIPPNGIPNILGADKDDHSRYRRLLAHAFSEKGMREQEPLIKQYVDLLIDRLSERARSGEVTDMVEWYNLVTFDLIGDLAFGDPFYCLRDRKTHPWVHYVPKNLQYTFQRSMLNRWSAGILEPYVLPQDVLHARLENYRYSEDKINRRIEFGGERGDFWDRIIFKSADDNKTGGGMTHGEMLNNASVLVLAGSETTATVLSVATYLLLNNPRVFDELKQEIRSAFTDTSEITLFSVSQLKYMLAVLDEAQRLYPAVPQPAVRSPPKGGGIVCGKYIPDEVCRRPSL